MTYELFCQILNENLIYEFTNAVSDEEREEWQHDWYVTFREDTYWSSNSRLIDEKKVTGWMHEHFHECSFDTHSFQLKFR